MPNVAAIDGITGPGRRTILIQGDVQEVNFKLGKKIIEITNKDGSMGSYDMVPIGSIEVHADGDNNFTIAVTKKEDEKEKEDGGDSKGSAANTKSGQTSSGSTATRK